MNGYQTEQKRLLLDYLSRHAECAFTPAELAQALADGGIGKSTVYRLVARLSEEGAVRRFAREGGGVAYQYLAGEHCASHLHLRCTACGRVIHLSQTDSDRLGRLLSVRYRFALDGSKTMLTGLCNQCTQENPTTAQKKETPHAC